MIEVTPLDYQSSEVDALATSLIGRGVALPNPSIPTQPIGIASDYVSEDSNLISWEKLHEIYGFPRNPGFPKQRECRGEHVARGGSVDGADDALTFCHLASKP